MIFFFHPVHQLVHKTDSLFAWEQLSVGSHLLWFAERFYIKLNGTLNGTVLSFTETVTFLTCVYENKVPWGVWATYPCKDRDIVMLPSFVAFQWVTVLTCSNRRHQCMDLCGANRRCINTATGSIHRLRTGMPMNRWTYTNSYIYVKTGSHTTQYWLW